MAKHNSENTNYYKYLKTLLGIKREKVLILANPSYRQLVADITKNKDKKFEVTYFPPTKKDGNEPPKEIAEKMLNYKTIIFLTEKSLTHTKARRNATKNGAKIASCPGITKEIFERCVPIDYKLMKKRHKKLYPIIKNSQSIIITSPAGTNITLTVHDTQSGPKELFIKKKGDYNNIPIGEVDSGIVRSKTNGTIVYDGSIAGVGKITTPIKLEVKKGKATIVSKNKDSTKLKKLLESVGPKAYNLAELGIGTNPNAILTGNVLEDEKVLGTCHIALGNDLSYNGTNNVPIHLDGIILKPTITVDGKIIMKDGKEYF